MTNLASLPELLAGLDERYSVGFAQSPDRDVFVRRTGPDLECHGSLVAQDWIYDLRLWHEDAECHWWWDQDEGLGRWAILDDSSPGLQRLTTTFSDRLLRGRVAEGDGGWSRLDDGHSTSLWVPVTAGVGNRLALVATEYTRTDDHGNVSVVTERLTQIKEL